VGGGLTACIRPAKLTGFSEFIAMRKSTVRRVKSLDELNVREYVFLVHGQVTIIFVVSVCLFVCLFVCAEFFSAVFDPISIKLGHMLYVWV